jgi:hypothetical protein
MWTSDNRGWRLICRDSAAIRAALPGDSHHRRLIDDLRCWTGRSQKTTAICVVDNAGGALVSKPRLGLDNDAAGIIVTTTSIEVKSVFQGSHSKPNNGLQNNQ